MAVVDVDLTKPDTIPDGEYVATITKAELTVPAQGDTNAKGDQKKPYLNMAYFIPDAEHTVSQIISIAAKFSLKQLVQSSGITFDESGFNAEDLIGQTVGIQVITKDDPTYGPRNEVKRIYKA